MISHLRIGNFKAFARAQDVPIKPITLIFGPNSAGKSSIIHSLALMHEAERTGNLDVFMTRLGGSSIDLGGFNQYVFRGDLERQVELEVQAKIGQGRLPPYTEFSRSYKNYTRYLGSICLKIGKINVHQESLDAASTDSNQSDTMQTRRSSEAQILEYGLKIGDELFLKLHQKADKLKIRDLEPRTILSYYYPPTISPLWLDREWKKATKYAEDNSFDILNDELINKLRSQIQDRTQDIEPITRRLLPNGLLVNKTNKISGQTDLSWIQDLFNRYHGPESGKFFSLATDDQVEFCWEVMKESINDHLRGYEEDIGTVLNKLVYLGPLRTFPSRRLAFSEQEDPNWVAGGGNAWNSLRLDSGLRQTVNEWLGDKRLATKYRLEERRLVSDRDLISCLKKHQEKFQNGDAEGFQLDRVLEDEQLKWQSEIVLIDERTNTEVTHRDVGIGLSQVIPVLATGVGSENKIICIEQPEIHLHPALQAELGDLFIYSAMKRGNTFLLETHSENLLLRILRRVRQTTKGIAPEGLEIKPDELSLMYVQPGEDGAKVIDIPVTKEGRFGRKWPTGFFDEGGKELFG